ncbi:hypothetical protein D3C85_736330 [compost metagenome]
MNQKIKFLKRIALFLCIIMLFANCASDDNLEKQDGNSNAKVKETQKWFNKYESDGENYFLLNNLQYNWDEAKITNSEDGTETTIVPIVESKKDNREFWEQRLYIYKTGKEDYKALVYEIATNKYVPLSSQSIDGDEFTGFISVWDLKSGFVRAARFENNQVIETGVVEVIDYTKRNSTNKAPIEAPCVYTDFGDGGCGGKGGSDNSTPNLPGTVLREVPVIAPSKGSPVEYYGPRSPVIGGSTTGGYTSPGGGASSGGSPNSGSSNNQEVYPDCASINFIKIGNVPWQEAAVKNIHFNIEIIQSLTPLITSSEIIRLPQAVSFQMPTNTLVGNTYISPGAAASVTAKAIDMAMRQTKDYYKAVPATELMVDQFFKKALKDNFELMAPGSRFVLNPVNTVPPTEYQNNWFFPSDCK